jgi:hypothetical protein
MGFDIKQSATGGFQAWDNSGGGQAGIVQCLAGQVNRAPTNTQAPSNFVLPANAQIVRIDIQVPVVSNAVTTATVSIGLAGGSATQFSAAQDVKSAIGNFSQAATANWVPTTAPRAMSVTYTETGGASTTGNFGYAVYFVVN